PPARAGSATSACRSGAHAPRPGGPPARGRAGRGTEGQPRRRPPPPRPPPARAPASRASPSGRRRASSPRQYLREILVAATGEADRDQLGVGVERAGERV